MTNGPILFDDISETQEEKAPASPATAPPVPDLEPRDQAAAMERVAAIAAAPPNRLARWFWGLLLSLVMFFAGIAAWDFALSLLARAPILGAIAAALIAGFCLVLLALSLRELAAFGRLRRVDKIQTDARTALEDGSLNRARAVVTQINALYRGRDDTKWGREALIERQSDILDADSLLALVESTVLAPLDARAAREVEAAARQVATVTALVPLALADVFTALSANMRMIRRIAEIYGGRSGTFGAWRLTRQVMTHLVATGAVAVGDDLIGSVAGGGVMSKLSRRFGEGIINGALTARVGVAAMEVCRPLAFQTRDAPSVTTLVSRALSGLFGMSKNA